MDAVLVRVGAVIRRGWPATIALVVLVGLGAGVAMATVTASRRTATAYDRLVERADVPDALVTFCPPGIQEVDDSTIVQCFTYAADDERETLLALPVTDVVASGSFRGVTIAPAGAPGDSHPASGIVMRHPGIPSVDGTQIVLDGRWYDPGTDEIVINEQLSERTGLGAGDEVRLTFWAMEDLGAPGRPGETFSGPSVTTRVVGVTRGLLDLMEAAGTESTMADDARVYGGPGLDRATPGAMGFGGVFVRSDLDEGELTAAMEAAFPGRPFNMAPAVGDDEREPVRQALDYQARGVLTVGGLVAVAAAVVAAQSVARQSRRESDDAALLGAIGFSRAQLSLAAILRGLVIAVPAAVVAVATSLALAPRLSFGLGRQADPSPRMVVDGPVLVLGALLVVAVVAASTWVPIWRLRDGGRGRVEPGVGRVSLLGPLPPAVATGLRMGRRGRAPSLALGTAVSSAALAAAVLTAAFGVTASMDALRATPERFGAPWDLSFGGVADDSIDAARELVVGNPDVDAAARLIGTDARIGDESGWVHAFDAVPGIDAVIHPPIIDGRAPAAVDEIALGRITMDAIGIEVGDQVEVRTSVTGSAPSTLTVVGTTMINDVFEHSAGRGGVVSVDWVRRMAPEASPDPYVVRLRPGADSDALARSLDAVFDGSVHPPVPQTAVRNVGRLRALPFLMAAFVGLLATGAFIHGLLLSVRRNRHQLAVLRSLGFTRPQVAASVAAHATALGVIAAAVGLPLGVILGRWGWRVITDQLGVVNVPATPLVPLALVLLAILALANVLATLPMWQVRRMHVGRVLRTE